MLGLFAWNGGFPAFDGPLVKRRVIGESMVRDLCHDLPMLQHAHFPVIGYSTDFDRVEAPLFEYAKNLVLATLLCDQQHALLRLAEHDLVGRHAGFALGDTIELDFNSHMPACAHLAGGARQPGS